MQQRANSSSAEFVRALDLTVAGEVRKWATTSDGGREVERFFCPICGS